MWATPPAGLCFSSTSTKSRNNSWGRQHTHTASHQLSPCLITHTHTLAVTLCSPFTHIFTHLSFSHSLFLPTCTHTYTHFCFVFFPRPSHTLTHNNSRFVHSPCRLLTHSLAGFCQMPGCPRGRRAVVVSEMWVSLAPLSAWCETHVSVECACHFQGVKHFCTVKMTGVPETQAPSQNVRPLACSKFCSKF